MKLGYTRVSTREQNADSQIARLEQAGCERIFVDVGYSSRVEDRPDWIECRKIQRPGDELVIPSLDRVAGTDSIAISVIRDHAARGVKLRSLDEPWMDIDPSTAMGEAMLKIMATLAQLRVDMIRENTRRGVEHARSQGRIGGRPTVMTPERIAMAKTMREADPPMSYAQIALALGVGRSSVSRALSKPEPVASPYLRPSTETITAATPVDEDTAERAPQTIVTRRAMRESFLKSTRIEEPAMKGWRGTATRLGLRLSPGPAEKAERDDTFAVAQHWPGPRTIAVVNGKGGASKTPTTVLLSAIFARFGGAGVLAWDANQTRGTLGWRTEQGPHESTVLDLLPAATELLGTGAQSADLARYVHHQTADPCVSGLGESTGS